MDGIDAREGPHWLFVASFLGLVYCSALFFQQGVAARRTL